MNEEVEMLKEKKKKADLEVMYIEQELDGDDKKGDLNPNQQIIEESKKMLESVLE